MTCKFFLHYVFALTTSKHFYIHNLAVLFVVLPLGLHGCSKSPKASPVQFKNGPVESLTLPAGFSVQLVDQIKETVTASNGKQEFILVVAHPAGPLAKLMQNGSLDKGEQRSINGVHYWLQLTPSELFVVCPQYRLLIEGGKGWKNDQVMELLSGIRVREEDAPARKQGE